MANKTIHYIATKTNIVDTLFQYCEQQGVGLTAFNEPHPTMNYLMIIEPVQIQYNGYALSKVWKPWLLEHFPGTKLIVASYCQSTHKCALNLLDLPASFPQWLDQLPAIREYPLQHGVDEKQNNRYDVFYDPWEYFLPMSGRDMKKLMEKFIEGHDEANSFSVQISRLRKKLTDIRDIMEEGFDKAEAASLQPEIDDLRKKAKQEWEYLMTRWRYYRPFFDWMPFKSTAELIQQEMEELQHLMKTWSKSGQKPAPEKVDALRNLVKDGLDRYIHAEDYW